MVLTTIDDYDIVANLVQKTLLHPSKSFFRFFTPENKENPKEEIDNFIYNVVPSGISTYISKYKKLAQ